MDTTSMPSTQEVGNTIFRTRKTGWNSSERSLLWEEVKSAREENRPLRTVFERVASATKRCPNSVRNFYYAAAAEGDPELKKPAAFVPFSESEIEGLLKKVLSAQAEGISVRSCTMALGSGDKKMMLRYQNKYRNVLKTNPELVKRVAVRMREEGLSFFDPFEGRAVRHRASRKETGEKRRYDLVEVMGKMVDDVHAIEGMDAAAFFKGLGLMASLAVAASREHCAGITDTERQALIEAEKKEALLQKRIAELKEEQDKLLSRILTQSSRNEKMREQMNSLLAMLRQLMNVNREFLMQNQVMKVSGLSRYIDELSKNVEECEKLMARE
ncbi:MAG: hypothetical protein Q8O09_06000 [Bacillota bacterium]|nr:hypothetical protein [Bacillota bacterium]